jgi:hypothetical protein
MQWLDGVSAHAPAFVACPLVDRWNPAWIDPLLAVHGKEGVDRYEESRFPPVA